MIAYVVARLAGQDPSDGAVHELKAADVREHPLRPEDYDLLWIDVLDAEADDIDWLRRTFNFHPLALEDVAGRNQRTKIDEYPGYYFGDLYAAAARHTIAGGHRITTSELQFFWGANFLVTLHDARLDVIDDLIARTRNGKLLPVVLARGSVLIIPDLTYRIIDGLADGYFPVVDALAEWANDIEEEMFSARRDRDTLEAIFSVKKQLFQLRKVVGPSRDAVNVLLRRDHTFFGDEFYPYFQDVYDHLVRLIDSLDGYRDLLSSLLDTYLSFVSNDVNQTVKKMTGVTAILMVDALIAGIYGMNFEYMPELQWTYGYLYALSLMLGVSLAMWLLLRRVRWL
jgi:magnesium transporter